MKAQKKALGSLLLCLSVVGLWSPAASAEKISEDRLRDSSIPEVMDYNSRLNTYFDDDSVLGDARHFFGITYGDNSIRNATRQTEALYKDLLRQQDDDFPTVRTRDIPSPFTTSVFTLQSPANFSQFD